MSWIKVVAFIAIFTVCASGANANQQIDKEPRNLFIIKNSDPYYGINCCETGLKFVSSKYSNLKFAKYFSDEGNNYLMGVFNNTDFVSIKIPSSIDENQIFDESSYTEVLLFKVKRQFKLI
jgi:hypothetical protein